MGALIVGVVFYFFLTGWGIATGIGLLRLKAWARVSVLVFSGFCLVTAVFAGVAISLIGPVIPQPPSAPPFSSVRNVILAMMAVPGMIAIWWLVYFNVKSVREQFEEYPTTGHYSRTDGSAGTLFLKPHPPLSIVLVAWMYLVALPGLVLVLFRDCPFILFGAVIRGPAAKGAYLLYLPVVLYVGIGLLKLKPAARILAIALSVLHLVNGALFVLLPGLEGRIATLLEHTGVPLPPQLTAGVLVPLVRVGLISGLGLSVAILWVLVTRKGAFTEARAAAQT
jgi:hypothetical protein